MTFVVSALDEVPKLDYHIVLTFVEISTSLLGDRAWKIEKMVKYLGAI